MMNRPRTIYTPTISQKRKDREETSFLINSNKKGGGGCPVSYPYQQIQPSFKQPPQKHSSLVSPFSRTTSFKQAATADPAVVMPNRLLAGYMAHEFLTQGTLLGQNFDPARAEAIPLSIAADSKKNSKPSQSNNSTSSSSSGGGGAGACGATDGGATVAELKRVGSNKSAQPNESYSDVLTLLKMEGTHIPGIVNPTQLARWIQM